MNSKTVLKIAKIGTAISTLTLVLPGECLFSDCPPLGILFFEMFFFGLIGIIPSLFFWTCIIYLLLSAFATFDSNDDDTVIIIIISLVYLLIFVGIEQYINYGNKLSYCTTAIFLIFSLFTLIAIIKRLLKRNNI